MKHKIESKFKRYILYLIVLLILYFLVDLGPFKKKKNREDIISQNIVMLDESTKKLDSLIEKDKEEIHNFFYNQKTYEKIRGLMMAYPSDKEIKINDNLSIILQKEDKLIRLAYKESLFDIINTKENPDASENMAVIKDVKVSENPSNENDYLLIHDLKTYLVDSYRQAAFDSYLDKLVEESIEENKRLIDKLE